MRLPCLLARALAARLADCGASESSSQTSSCLAASGWRSTCSSASTGTLSSPSTPTSVALGPTRAQGWTRGSWGSSSTSTKARIAPRSPSPLSSRPGLGSRRGGRGHHPGGRSGEVLRGPASGPHGHDHAGHRVANEMRHNVCPCPGCASARAALAAAPPSLQVRLHSRGVGARPQPPGRRLHREAARRLRPDAVELAGRAGVQRLLLVLL